ncbi:STAS/SEC14 domain-containing protein [Natrialba sp. SSL1]|uniref:STAS/SEC14 domain-containing protein n=1 Tax=Natrialba sp. SSL1 TaxID=1869245 RepID=UPI0008F92FFD|nr:STAS/SEC14 domain-containing protein [Natrialba sp. SSL1]OIB57133.1 hypothetical protein BBD46_15470 [Natrialba sp. SSL1]
MAYYERDHLTIEWDSDLETVLMNWQAFAKEDDYRDGLDAGLDLAIEHGAENWLADLRDLGTVTQDDRDWTHDDWHPRAFESSLQNMAIVQPASVVSNMSVEEMVTEVGENTTSRIFDNRDDAREWLRNQ